MKKFLLGFGVFLMVFGMSFSYISASSTAPLSNDKVQKENKPTASKYVEVTKKYPGKINIPDTYKYVDSLGYSGVLPIVSSFYNPKTYTTTAKYAGTVTCEGVCPMTKENK